MVAKGLYNERLHADYDTLIDVDEYDQSSNSIKVACKRLLSHSISIDNINFIKGQRDNNLLKIQRMQESLKSYQLNYNF